MAQTSTSINACDVVIKIQTTEGDMLDISGSSNSVSQDLNNKLGERRTFGSDYTIRKACGKDATVNLKVIYTENEREAMEVLKDWYFNHAKDKRNVEVYVPDDEAGSDKYTYPALLESLSIPVESEDAAPILVTAVLKPAGEFTYTKVAS